MQVIVRESSAFPGIWLLLARYQKSLPFVATLDEAIIVEMIDYSNPEMPVREVSIKTFMPIVGDDPIHHQSCITQLRMRTAGSISISDKCKLTKPVLFSGNQFEADIRTVLPT